MTNGNKTFRVKFVSDDKYGFKKGEIYDAIEAREPFFGVEMLCITDSSGEEYAYPASWFERIDS